MNASGAGVKGEQQGVGLAANAQRRWQHVSQERLHPLKNKASSLCVISKLLQNWRRLVLKKESTSAREENKNVLCASWLRSEQDKANTVHFSCKFNQKKLSLLESTLDYITLWQK